LAVRVLDFGLNCQECDAKLKRERGCECNGLIPFYIEDKQFFRCPLKLIDELSWQYIRAFGLYQKDILPNGSGWLNESDKYLSAMMVISNEFNTMQQEKAKQRQRKKHGRKTKA